MSSPSATDMSSAAGLPVEDVVAWPTSFRTWVNVRGGFRRFDDLVVDAGQVQQRLREVVDLFRGDVRDTPVDFRTAAVWAVTFWAFSNPRTPPGSLAQHAAPAKPPPNSARLRPNRLNVRSSWEASPTI
jgi:hypothetical protein